MRNVLPVALFLTWAFMGSPLVAGDAGWEGVWTAPSLSKPEVPIVVTLLPAGKATEKIGDFQGAGTWAAEGEAARILWDSGWVGLLRPTAKGGWELLTWKKETPRDQPPDDIQPATKQP